MITISPSQRIFISMEPLDFRKGINGTVGICRQLFRESHLSGAVFLFINRSATMVRLYSFDGHGEYLLVKRIAKGKFKWWYENSSKVNPAEVVAVLAGAAPIKDIPKPWKSID